MIGKQSDQVSFNEIALWSGGRPVIDPDSIHGCLAQWGNKLIRDEDFEELYSGTGRPAVSPALLAKVVLLMFLEGVSDREAEQRARFDLRWKAALDLPITEAGFDHTALCRFRARLILKDKERLVFDRFLSLAQDAGLIKAGGLQLVDSTYVLGEGATQDTYEMIRTALRNTTRRLRKKPLALIMELANKHAEKPKIDWKDVEERRNYLQELVDDSRNLLAAVREMEMTDEARETVDLLARIVEQDIDESSGRVEIRKGVTPDRIVSAHDPEIRHGRKTRNKRFDGHKVQVMVDEASEIITQVAVTPGNRPDGDTVGALLDTAKVKPGVLMGDTAYGTLAARDEMEKRQVIPVAPLPHGNPVSQRKDNRFAKGDFLIDMQNKVCRCPAGNETKRLSANKREMWFRFSTKVCNSCPLRDRCTRHGIGKEVKVHPEEARRQEILAQTNTEEFQQLYRKRAKAERVLATLVHYGARQARYVGHKATGLQLYFTAAGANILKMFRHSRKLIVPLIAPPTPA